MPLTRDDAARNLGDIEQVGARSSRAYGYQAFSRHLILWGGVWIAGQGASLIWPDKATYVWWALIVAAVAITCILPRRLPGATWRVPAVVLIALGFVAAIHAILGPVSPRPNAAVAPLVISAIYAGLGLWLGIRFTIVGLALAACVVAGFYLLGEDFKTWMGFIGGGALVLGGLWLRQI